MTILTTMAITVAIMILFIILSVIVYEWKVERDNKYEQWPDETPPTYTLTELRKMKKAELIELAGEWGLDFTTRHKKDDIIVSIKKLQPKD